ncbi:hypothetical protein PUNSTDRAFT_82585 [Punctularia strigosozonata HHB-11173 SS5]|uniref:uncharacterized protein n=1 Tax=Punctularia strigosozonata (strain HHB-11173) TaxID=741275 RepID=UPI000441800A|nr:uncharacterized protein PUNSTDRAFT_82585 [Punctularia strigosozonata HHB-11173 SS5]EIN13038.1 hypothetical protein PUNSTDRAFT_82585 [Punctularia strigosozonata HHB-11173 SS5]
MGSAYSRWFDIHDTFDPACLYVTSPFLSPAWLTFVRILLGLYALAGNCYNLAYTTSVLHQGSSYFSYFTRLSWIGDASYLLAVGVQTLFYTIRLRRGFGTRALPAPSNNEVKEERGSSGSRTSGTGTTAEQGIVEQSTKAVRGNAYPLQQWPKILQFLHVLLWGTFTTFPIIVTVVFWSLLSGPTALSTVNNAWGNISGHLLNSVFALFEIFFTNAPPVPWTYLPFLVILLALYMGVAYITFATQHFYVYDFLDPGKQHALLAAYIIGIAVGCCLIFSLVRGVIVLRQRLARRFFPRRAGGAAFGDDAGVRAEGIDEWETVEHEDALQKGAEAV